MSFHQLHVAEPRKSTSGFFLIPVNFIFEFKLPQRFLSNKQQFTYQTNFIIKDTV